MLNPSKFIEGLRSALLTLFVWLLAASWLVSGATRPNVLFVATDDMRPQLDVTATSS